MLRIITVNIVVLCINFLLGQEIPEMELLTIEKEYFETNDPFAKQRLLLKKVDLLITSRHYEKRTFNEIKRIDSRYLDTSVLYKFYWNSAIIAYLNNENYYVSSYLKRANTFKESDNFSFKLLYYLNNSNVDSLKSNQYFRELCSIDSSFNQLKCLSEVENFELKHKKILLNAGIVIPGSGAILNGNILKGLTSTSLNTLSFFAIRYLINEKLYFNAIGWGGNLISKFYLGNLRMTENLVDKKEAIKKNKLASDCELILQELLNKYPLIFL